jgi:hypothetical protein
MFDYTKFDLILVGNKLVLLCIPEYLFEHSSQVAKSNEQYNIFEYHIAMVIQDELQFHLQTNKKS